MSKPISIHTINLIQVSRGRKAIMPKQTITPSTGTSGTNGVLKARGASGFDFLKIMTPIHTSIKANSVPMLVISPTTRPGINAAKMLTNIMKKIFEREGVLNFGCIIEKNLGNNPSVLME